MLCRAGAVHRKISGGFRRRASSIPAHVNVASARIERFSSLSPLHENVSARRWFRSPGRTFDVGRMNTVQHFNEIPYRLTGKGSFLVSRSSEPHGST
jgi:hypothetical protein